MNITIKWTDGMVRHYQAFSVNRCRINGTELRTLKGAKAYWVNVPCIANTALKHAIKSASSDVDHKTASVVIESVDTTSKIVKQLLGEGRFFGKDDDGEDDGEDDKF